jgi:hypothetical protein
VSESAPAEVWLPTTEQIVMAQERAILVALEVTLLMAERTLRAEHTTLGDDSDEPNPPHLAIAGSILLLAASLRELLAAYRVATDLLLGDT